MSDMTTEYLVELLQEKRQLTFYGNTFIHVERLIDQEISRVRAALFQVRFNKDEIELPEPIGDVVVKKEKIYVPVKDHPDYNFVGRILGPRGMTSKQFEIDTGCRIMVRGKGSLRNNVKEEVMHGKPTWEHLEDELHVILQCEDTPNRAKIKLDNAVKQLDKLILPTSEGAGELKRKQLLELAIINGTYRPTNKNKDSYKLSPYAMVPPMMVGNSPIRPPGFESHCFMTQTPLNGQPILGAYNTSPITSPNQHSALLSSFFPSSSSPPYSSHLAHLLRPSPLPSDDQQQTAFSFNYVPPSPPDFGYDNQVPPLLKEFKVEHSPLKYSK